MTISYSQSGARNNDMTVGQNALSVTAESVLAANANRIYAEVKNTDASVAMYVGKDNTVSSTTGFLLAAGESLGFEDYTGAIWMIAASVTPTVSFIEW